MKFEDLDAWKAARNVTNKIYAVCRNGRLSKDFTLSDQLKRASLSIMANLAEGFEREHKRDKLRFWNIALSSAGEVRSLLYILFDNKLTSKADVEELFDLIIKASHLTKGLIRSYRAKY